MLTLAGLKAGERLCDLGCGDGRLLQLAVAEHGACRATGFELDAMLVRIAREAAAGDPRVSIHHEDALRAGPVLCECDVVTLFLSTRGNAEVLPLLQSSLKPGARVVSNSWEMPPAIQAKATAVLMKGSGVPLYLYEAPL